MTSTFAPPRWKVLLVGHGPQGVSPSAKFLATCKVAFDGPTGKIVCVRNVPEWVTATFPTKCITVVNCDVNSAEDQAPEQTDYVFPIFLYHVVDMKHMATQRGWKRFYRLPTPVGCFFTGTQAMRYIMESYDCEELWCAGIDFDDKYLEAAWSSTKRLPNGGSAAQNWEQLRAALRLLMADLKTQLQQHNTVVVTSSPSLQEHFKSSVPLREIEA